MLDIEELSKNPKAYDILKYEMQLPFLGAGITRDVFRIDKYAIKLGKYNANFQEYLVSQASKDTPLADLFAIVHDISSNGKILIMEYMPYLLCSERDYNKMSYEDQTRFSLEIIRRLQFKGFKIGDIHEFNMRRLRGGKVKLIDYAHSVCDEVIYDTRTKEDLNPVIKKLHNEMLLKPKMNLRYEIKRHQLILDTDRQYILTCNKKQEQFQTAFEV